MAEPDARHPHHAGPAPPGRRGARAYAGIGGTAIGAFEEAVAGAIPGADTDVVRALVPYVLDRGR